MASSSARTLDSRPTTKGVIMYGKITTSRIGIIGRRFVSDFSFEVSIVLPSGVTAPGYAVEAGSGSLTGLFQYCKTDFLREHHLPGYLELPNLLVGRQI